MSAVVRVWYPFSFRSSSRSLLLLLLFLGSSDVVLFNDVVLSSLEYELIRLVFAAPWRQKAWHARSKWHQNITYVRICL